MIMGELVAGIVLIIFGLVVMSLSNFISKNIPLFQINQFKASKSSKKRVSIETTSEFYGAEKGRKIIFYLFGVLPLVMGIIIFIFGLAGIIIWTD